MKFVIIVSVGETRNELITFLKYVRADLRDSEAEFYDTYVAQLQKLIWEIKGSRKKEEREMVLLVVDTQRALVNDGLYCYEQFVENIEHLIQKARENYIEVIYVVHDDGMESELTKGKSGFEIFEKFKPSVEEQIFVKNVNSAFKGTGLLTYLLQKNEKEVIVVGLQTDKCINATIISGFEHGLSMIIPAGANSTVDNAYMTGKESYLYYNEYMWKDRYAECISIEEVLRKMRGESNI